MDKRKNTLHELAKVENACKQVTDETVYYTPYFDQSFWVNQAAKWILTQG